ncbi:Zn-dependent exopeptidase M28, partial [candidate division WOR-3 bacterium]|nr:Zn-dependent exopeptidase M28 [candidate division WOR-3 bacterium]
DSTAIAACADRGWPVRVLDRKLAPGEYFITYKAGIGLTSAPGQLLYESGRWRLVRLSEPEARVARATGYPMVRLPEFARPLAPEPAPLPIADQPDTTVARLVSLVSLDTLLGTMRDLVAFGTRYSYNIKCESAAFYLHERFSALELEMRLDTYYLRQPTTRAFNVEATIPGRVRPDSIVIACAHFDSYSNIRTIAPGADDNATGTAAILEIARVLRETPMRWTVKLLGFSGEEQWMKGSYHWVESTAVPQAMKIAGVYNIDMVAYTAADSNLLFVNRNTPSTPLAVLAESVNNWYSIGLRVMNYLDEDCAGDNTPFWERGYRSVFALEDSEWGIWNGSNPHYHTTHDTIGNLTLSQVRRTTQMALACIATMASPCGLQDVAEAHVPHRRPAPGPTVVGRLLCLPPGSSRGSSLVSADGRTVLALRPGSNDLSHLSPGVYFLRRADSDSARRIVRLR